MTSEPANATSRRVELTIFAPLILAALSSIGPFAIDTAFPAFPAMQLDYGVGSADMQLTVSAYLYAFGIMSIFHGPISDAVGRRPVMMIGVALFTLASVGCALSPSLDWMLLFRVLQGLTAGGGVIVSRTIIRDVYDGARAQRLMSQVAMIFGLAPAIAPIVGGLILQVAPWQAIFWFMTGFTALLVVVVFFFLPETHPVENRIPFRPGAMVTGLVEVVSSAGFHRVAWATGLTFAGLFLYVGGAAIFVVELLGKGETDFWVFFVPTVGGLILGSWVSSRSAGRISGRTLISGGMSVAVAAAGINVLLAVLPTAARLPWAVVGPAVMAFGIATTFPTLQLALLDMFPRGRGAVTSASTFLVLMLNATITGFLVPVVTDSVLDLATTSLVFVVAGAMCWMWHVALDRRATRAAAVTIDFEGTDAI